MGGKASKLAKPLPNTISRTPVGSILPTARFVPTTEPTSTPKQESTKIPCTNFIIFIFISLMIVKLINCLPL